MATDGPDPPPCKKEIFEQGTAVFMTDSIPSNAMERWIEKVRKLSRQPVDWHFNGGRAVVLALGDLNRVIGALWMLRGQHDLEYKKAMDKMGLPGQDAPWNMLWPRKVTKPW